jgi:hypothetical protein
MMSLLSWFRSMFGGSASGPDTSCLVCDSTDLETLAPDAYRCLTCGHEGGDGLPAWIAGRRRAEILAMSEAQRGPLACKNLEGARNLLSGVNLGWAGGSVGAEIASRVVTATVGVAFGASMRGMDDREEEEQRLLVGMVRDLMEAEQLLEDAATALDDAFSIPARERLANLPLRLDRYDARDKLNGVARGLMVEYERIEAVRTKAEAGHY